MENILDELYAPLRYFQLLSVFHPHHLDVWLRNFTFKDGLLLLCYLDIFNMLGEFNHTSWNTNAKMFSDYVIHRII